MLRVHGNGQIQSGNIHEWKGHLLNISNRLTVISHAEVSRMKWPRLNSGNKVNQTIKYEWIAFILHRRVVNITHHLTQCYSSLVYRATSPFTTLEDRSHKFRKHNGINHSRPNRSLASLHHLSKVHSYLSQQMPLSFVQSSNQTAQHDVMPC